MRSRLRNTLAVFATVATTAWMTTTALASPPYINYQGTINDSAGNPMNNQSQEFTFNIYNAASSGTLVWGPFKVTAPVLNGRFNVILGPTDLANPARPLDAVFAGSDDRFLSVTVGSTAITPRQRFLSNPYAYSASIVANPRFELTPTNFAVKTNFSLEFGKGIPSKAAGNGVVSYGTDSLDIVGGGTNTENRLTTIRGNIKITGSYLDADGTTNHMATAEESLRIVAGQVGNLGQILGGVGFTAGISGTNNGTLGIPQYFGPYTVKFDKPFSAPPVITVTPRTAYSQTPPIANINSVTTTQAVILIYEQGASQTDFNLSLSPFHFIAIGPR